MSLASLLFSGRDWLPLAAGLLVVALVFLIWNYRQAPVDKKVRVAGFFLKLLGVLALVVCLLEPLWSGQRARPGANQLVIVADNSQGMQIHDRGSLTSRGDAVRGLLTGDQNGWLNQLDEDFQVRRYLFDARLLATKDYSELIFDGRSSSIGAALQTVKERFAGRAVAGVILLTDGNATDITGTEVDLTGMPPVYPVVVGKDEPIKDVSLNNVVVSQTSFEDAPVTIQADAAANGYAGVNIVAQLLDRTGKKVEEQTLRAQGDGVPLAFRFQIRPEKSGVSFYRLRVAAKDEMGQFNNPATSTEATLANNSRIVAVDRGKGPYRILYVSGRPNWEFKFLNRAVSEDDQVQMVALIRVAKREPKFDFRGRAGETSNPLFRGFGNQSKDEIERYDQPVLVRLNTRDQFELRDGFPKIPEDLYGYHAVILDDLEAEFFTADQMSLLQKFVSERGGGFLMLGGAECFYHGKYDHTPIGDLLPVYCDRVSDEAAPPAVRLNLTREGWLQPWARLRNNESEEKSRLEGMPPFLVMNRVRDIKPGASVIGTVSDGKNHLFPALVVQRYGNGRAGALTIGDFWHWGLRDAESHKDMDKAWRQMMRWLVADVPQRINLQVELKRGDANQPVQLLTRVRDEKFQPLDNASTSVKITPVMQDTTNSTTIRITAEPALTEAGLYQATYVPHDTGGYLVEATVTNSVGAEVGRAEAAWTTDLAAEEFKSLTPNYALLEMIAKKTGGEVVPLEKLAAFAKTLPTRNMPVMESWSYPLWHQPLVFLFALACFVAEWGLRRTKGLA
jgi:uncharacterized membrane protein